MMVDEAKPERVGEYPAFWDVVRSHMERCGIEDVEELHRRFVETEYAYIPIRGRHKGRPVPLEEFKRHVAGEHPMIYGELGRGLVEVLGITEDRQQGEFYLSYMLGRPSMGVHPTRSPL